MRKILFDFALQIVFWNRFIVLLSKNLDLK